MDNGKKPNILLINVAFVIETTDFPVQKRSRTNLKSHKIRASEDPEALKNTGDRERIRTAGLPLRRRSLYPAELHNQVLKTERDYIIIPEDYKGRSPRA